MRQSIVAANPEERRALDIAWQSTCPRCRAAPGFPCVRANGALTAQLHVPRRVIGLTAVYGP